MVSNDSGIWKTAVNLAQQYLKASSPNTSSVFSNKSFSNARVAAEASPSTNEKSLASMPVTFAYPVPNLSVAIKTNIFISPCWLMGQSLCQCPHQH